MLKGSDGMNALYISSIIRNDTYGNASSYHFCLPVVRNLNKLNLQKPVTFFIGENGTGKSTLMEAIAVNYGFNAEGGSRHFRFSTEATHSNLHKAITLGKGVQPKDGYFLRAESFYNVATEIERLDAAPSFDAPIKEAYGGKSLHAQSHGESFLSLVQNCFFGHGLYLLDEPEAALSPTRQMTLLALIHALVNNQSQFIIATHSPILLSYPNADIYELTEDEIRLTPYKETEHYTLTRRFLNHPEDILKYLLD